MGGGRPTGPDTHWKPPQGPWQRPNRDEIMRLELCESLMAVASERPTKAQHAQELEMSIYEASPTKEVYLQSASMNYNQLRELLQHIKPRLAGRTRGQSVKYPRAPLPGSSAALKIRSSAVKGGRPSGGGETTTTSGTPAADNDDDDAEEH